jgi:hypothetical protein
LSKGEWRECDQEDEDLSAAVIKHIIGQEGDMAKELFVDLMDYMAVRWDNETTRRSRRD